MHKAQRSILGLPRQSAPNSRSAHRSVPAKSRPLPRPASLTRPAARGFADITEDPPWSSRARGGRPQWRWQSVWPSRGAPTGHRRAARHGRTEIDPAEADVIRRIFQNYAAGVSPKKIALMLNADGVAGPRNGAWSSSTLNGNRARGTGIFNNELYIGRLRWNRLAYAKDPETGRRRSRQRPEGEHVITETPELRIVEQDLWDAVKLRQDELDCRQGQSGVATDRPAPFWSKQRARYLFSGLMRCGVCGGGFSKISAQHFGCSTARNKGPTACTNLRTIRRDDLETTVLGALRERLMDPDAFQVFAREFTAEWNRLQGNDAAEQIARTGELQRVRQQIERLVDAITEGMPAAAVRDRLGILEQRRLALEVAEKTATAPAPRLHPNLAEVYRRKVSALALALEAEDAANARDLGIRPASTALR
ncbi:MAG TPA: recombinase family protein [Acetobacteraceae bacterium]|nr:recombinase family protein [Acetobacteraceae bacterium]